MHYSNYHSIQLDSGLMEKLDSRFTTKDHVSKGLFEVLSGSTQFFFDPTILIKIYDKETR